MPKTADATARSKRSGTPPGRLGRPRQVIEQAGSVPDSGPVDPLVLRRGMRTKLQAALDVLLGDRAVRGRPDAERLTGVVVLAKVPVGSSKLMLRAGEMARWLGFSESYVDHRVLPGLRESGSVGTAVTQNSEGYVNGLEWELLPLTAALAGRGSALVLDKPEASTLLRLCERLFGPGWAPVDKPETPAGLLAERRGKGAATARLALLQLVLRARSDGRVRLVGGAVKKGHRRSAATVAHVLRCSIEDAEQVLDDLLAEDVVEVHEAAQGSGAGERLFIPAVAAAYGRSADSELSLVDDEGSGSGDVRDGELGCAVCGCAEASAPGVDALVLEGDGWVQEGFDVVDDAFSSSAVGALRDQMALPASGDGADMPSDQGEQAPARTVGEDGGVVDGALHHAPHAPVVDVVGSLAVSSGFSGEADRGVRDLPERAGARKDRPVPDAGTSAAASQGCDGPLRGERQAQVSDRQGGLAEGPKPSGGACGGDTVVAFRPAPLPAGLEGVLAPVRTVWERITRIAARAHVAARVRLELGALCGVVGGEDAEQVLAERLERRLDELRGVPVKDPVAWLLGRGLVQRQWCWSQLCDEGSRMDTGGPCPSCQVVIGDRRGLRGRIAAETAREMPGLGVQELKAETEKRLQAAVAHEAAARAARHERALAEREAREQVIARRKADFAAAEEARRAAPCADCGIPEAAGLCMACTHRRSTERTLAEAVDLAVMARADLTDPAAVAEATGRCAADTRRLLENTLERLRAEGADELGLMLDAPKIAGKIRDQRHESLRGRLMRSPEAEAEADKAFDAELRLRHRLADRAAARRAAERAADEALLRAVEFLFAERGRQLAAARAQETVPAGWVSRRTRPAGQPLPHDTVRPTAAVEAVSAA
ncbi:hypothetical protein [Streptomyces sp. bgisy154]|uniref:hypothetical protein n=1 Tax=Streptomyces sp. bgisy154 TaxID=3413794 RepID=UPI003D70DB43